MTSYNVDEPIYAPATAYAPSALAVIRLSGKNTIEMLSQAFSSPSRLNKAAGKTLVHGYILDEENVRIDEVVLAVYREGSGYTGEEAVEISCHGSLVVLKRLFTRLEQLGFKRAEKGEFTFRAFMHGRMDLTQAEAVEEIIHSKSEISQEKALDRLSGKLRDSLAAVKTRLVDILASLEVQLDYAEDEIIDEWVFPEAEVSSIISSLKALSSTAAFTGKGQRSCLPVRQTLAKARFSTSLSRKTVPSYLRFREQPVISLRPGLTLTGFPYDFSTLPG